MSRLALCLVAVLPATALGADSPKVEAKLALRTAAALYDGIESATLDNGLRVYLKPIPSASSVTTMLVYKVGSSDEDKTFTGLSHYLEHLLFKGTAKLKPGDIDKITFRAGGSNNAYTSNDVTAYHFTLPSAWMNAALEVEADRMRNVRIDKEHEFDKEKGAVISELARNEDGPWDLEYKAIYPILFGKGHPYGHPVIGETRHVRDATEKVIKAHYDAWYHPNNASLVIVGGFDPKEALATVKKLFGPIPSAKLPPRKTIPDDAVKLPARTQFASKFSQARLMIGFPTVKSGDPDQPALAVLDAILSRGKRSRLYRSLVEGAAVASDAGSDHSPGRYPGWMNVTLELLPDKDRAGAEKLLLAQLAGVRDKEVSAEELARAKQLLLAATIYRNEDTYGLANSIGEAVTLNDLDFARKYLPAMLTVTAADVQRVAKKYLDPKRSATVWSVPAEEPKAGRSGTTAPRTISRHNTPARAERAATGIDLKKTRRVELPNGLVVLLYEDRRLPLFVAGASLRASGIYQDDTKLGVARLTGDLLDEGTAKRSGAEISDAIETVGGALSLSSTGGTVKSLSPDRKLALSLLLESMVEPTFPADAFRRAHARLLAEITESETRSNARALRAFTQAAYGAHPLGRPSSGTTKTVFGLTRADCEAFHKRVFVPSNTILVLAGDFDGDEMLAEIKRLTADWKGAPLPKADLRQGGHAQGVHDEGPDDAEGGATPDLHGARRHPARQPRLLQAARNGPHPRHRAGVHRPHLGPAARPGGAGVHGLRENDEHGRDRAGAVHLLHRHGQRELRQGEGTLPRGAEPHPRHEGDARGTRRRQGVPDRQPDPSLQHPRRHRRAARGDRALQARPELRRGLPEGGQGGDAGGHPGRREEVPRPGAHDPRRGWGRG